MRQTIRYIVIGASVAVGLAVAATIIVPTCYTLECIACSYVLNADLCAAATGG